jgi:hypothetical protein
MPCSICSDGTNTTQLKLLDLLGNNNGIGLLNLGFLMALEVKRTLMSIREAMLTAQVPNLALAREAQQSDLHVAHHASILGRLGRGASFRGP